MELNQIQNTGTWGEQVAALNQNFTKISAGVDIAIETAEAIGDIVIDQETQETLAGLILKVNTVYDTGARAGGVITNITSIL